jgi:hypothetical protein
MKELGERSRKRAPLELVIIIIVNVLLEKRVYNYIYRGGAIGR